MNDIGYVEFKCAHLTDTCMSPIQKAINSVPSIRNPMLTYDKLIALGSLDTSAMVKKADALVRTYSNRIRL
jgi:hypothetical protein